MNDYYMMLNVSDLKDQTKVKRNHDYYKSILDNVYKRIKIRNSKKYTYLIYSINPIQFGMPLLNVDHAIKYILKKLCKGGFQVVRMNYNTIYCNWNIV